METPADVTDLNAPKYVPVSAEIPIDDDLIPDDRPDDWSPPPREGFWTREERWWSEIESWLSVIVVGALMIYTFAQLHPGHILANNTPAGGDLGAHVWGPAYLRDHIIPHGRLSGWAPDWYGGFPMYQFYMVIPALIVLLFDVILPYGIALKITAVLGLVTMPLVCWALGRLSGLRKPMPELLAVAGTWFIFDDTYKIYGGNIASTMAGEYSHSVSLSMSIVFFGLMIYAIRTGRLAWLAAIMAALAALSHGLVLFFVGIGGIVITLVYLPWERIWAAVTGRSVEVARFLVRPLIVLFTVGPVAVLLSAFWLVPFVARQRFMTDMFYERRPTGNTPDDKRPDSYWEMLYPQSRFWDRIMMLLVVIAVYQAFKHRRRPVIVLFFIGLIYFVWAPLHPQLLLWNARLLPFMYLMRYCLVFLGLLEVVRFIAKGFWGDRPVLEVAGRTRAMALSFTLLITAFTGAFQSFHLWDLPFGGQRYDGDKQQWFYNWPRWGLPRFEGSDKSKGYVSAWAEWNFKGYEGKAAYGEYYGVMTTMKELGATNGCGRALWENNNDQDKYGTPMAQMLLPFWTDGCIASMEGLFFEASGSTPYHFLMASALSERSSNPVRRLRYEDGNVTKGVEYLKAMGVRYYMAYKPSVIAKADQEPDLKRVAESGPWVVYEVTTGNDLVVALPTQPVVVPDAKSRDEWLEVGSSWFQHQSDWLAVPVDNGPAEWERVDLRVTSDHITDDRNLAVVFPENAINTVNLEPVKVTNVVAEDNSVSFEVDKVGVPVLVRVGYFPNWKVKGATGPYRAAPNFMVVVPTSNKVSLEYGSTGVDLASQAATLVGIGATLVMWRRRPERFGGDGVDPYNFADDNADVADAEIDDDDDVDVVTDASARAEEESGDDGWPASPPAPPYLPPPSPEPPPVR